MTCLGDDDLVHYEAGSSWELESILDARFSSMGWEVLVKWSGGWEPTWEPINMLDDCPDALDTFLDGRRLVCEGEKYREEDLKLIPFTQEQVPYRRKKGRCLACGNQFTLCNLNRHVRTAERRFIQ